MKGLQPGFLSFNQMGGAHVPPPAQPVDTSREAAERIEPAQGTLQRRVLDYISSCGERAAAIEETCFAVTAEDVEKRAGEWLTRYGKPVKDETWGRAFDVCANGWAERKAIPAPAVFQAPPTRKGARPQVSYTDEQRKAADERAAAQIAEREARQAVTPPGKDAK